MNLRKSLKKAMTEMEREEILNKENAKNCKEASREIGDEVFDYIEDTPPSTFDNLRRDQTERSFKGILYSHVMSVLVYLKTLRLIKITKEKGD